MDVQRRHVSLVSLRLTAKAINATSHPLLLASTASQSEKKAAEIDMDNSSQTFENQPQLVI
jgi:hypothetical protein